MLAGFVFPTHLAPFPHFCSAVAEADGIEPLISVLSAKRDGAVASAATVLTNLAMQEPLRLSIQSHGIMSAMVEPLHSTNSIVQSRAALAVSAIGCDADARAEVKHLCSILKFDVMGPNGFFVPFIFGGGGGVWVCLYSSNYPGFSYIFFFPNHV